MEALLELLPAISSFLAGPAGGLAASGVEFLANKLGATDKTVDGIKQALAGCKATDIIQLKQMDLDFQKFCKQNDIQLQLAQIAVDQVEASSTNWFVSGARPAALWIGVIGLGYAAILEPVARFIGTVIYKYSGAYPVLDTNITMQLLFGLLGLGAYRTVEKVQGVARQ